MTIVLRQRVPSLRPEEISKNLRRTVHNPVDFHDQLFHFNSCIQFDLADFLFNQGVKEETFSMVVIGSATASSIFLIALLLWAFLLTAERLSELVT